jgi:hypothetical protein
MGRTGISSVIETKELTKFHNKQTFYGGYLIIVSASAQLNLEEVALNEVRNNDEIIKVVLMSYYIF